MTYHTQEPHEEIDADFIPEEDDEIEEDEEFEDEDEEEEEKFM